MENKEEKAQILADKLNNILPLIDGFMNSLDDEDFELLEESKKALAENNINKAIGCRILANKLREDIGVKN